MKKEDKERVVAELTEKLRRSETLFVADYRGLTMPQIDALRGRLIEQGARLSVVKNTLTRRAAEAAGADALLALLDEIIRAKPAAAKGRYIKKITLTSTMGPGIHVDPTRTRDIAEELDSSSASEAATVGA